MGIVAVVRTTATGEVGWNDREGAARPLTTSAKVVRGVTCGGVVQLIAGVGGVLCGVVTSAGGTANNAGGVLVGLPFLPDFTGGAWTLFFGDDLFLRAICAPRGEFLGFERRDVPGEFVADGGFLRRGAMLEEEPLISSGWV